MKELKAQVGDGWLVAMSVEAGPGNARHNHTLRHWLRPHCGFDAEGCREHVVVEERALTWSDLDTMPQDSEKVLHNPKLWTAQVRRAVDACHEHGFWPVYLGVVRRSGLPRAAGSKGWYFQRGQRWKLVAEIGVEVHGDLKGRAFEVASVMKSVVVKTPPAPQPCEDKAFQALVRQMGLRR